jgi:hypothetical protein
MTHETPCRYNPLATPDSFEALLRGIPLVSVIPPAHMCASRVDLQISKANTTTNCLEYHASDDEPRLYPQETGTRTSVSRAMSSQTKTIMYFSTLLLLPTLALSSVLPARHLLPTGQIVKQDVINIHNAVLSLDATVQSFQGSPFPTSLVDGTPVLLGVADIHFVNRAGFRHALAASPFTVEDTKDVIDTVVSTGASFTCPSFCSMALTSNAVNVSIPASIEHLKAKAPAFKEGDLTITVIASLKLLIYDHDTFSAAVLAKSNQGVGDAEITKGEDAVANIHNAIQSGITFFEGQVA